MSFYSAPLSWAFSLFCLLFQSFCLSSQEFYIFEICQNLRAMKKLEDLLDKCRVPQNLQRGLALVLEVLILALIMTGIVSIVVPTLTTAVNQLSATIGKVAPQLAKWLQQSGLLSSSQLKDLTKQLQNSGIVNRAISLLGSLTGNISAIFGNFFSVIMSIFLMFAFLSSKENLQTIHSLD